MTPQQIKVVQTSWVIGIFGESHLAVLYRTDFIVRRPWAERFFPYLLSSKEVSLRVPVRRRVRNTAPSLGKVSPFPSWRCPCSRLHEICPRAKKSWPCLQMES
jgi:hypothetical protein